MNIYDDTRVQRILETYKRKPKYLQPFISIVLSSRGFFSNRKIINSFINKIGDEPRNRWLGRFLSVDDAQSIPAWNEFRSYILFESKYEVEFDPQIIGDNPDIVINTNGMQIAIEIATIMKTESDRSRERHLNGLRYELRKIRMPFEIQILNYSITDDFNFIRFRKVVASWLDEFSKDTLLYKDDFGNRVFLKGNRVPSNAHVGCIYISNDTKIETSVLRGVIAKKSDSHRNLRKRNFPYIVLIFSENWKLSAHEIIQEWLGKSVVMVNRDTNRIERVVNDLSGVVIYNKRNPPKGGVSGFLIPSSYEILSNLDLNLIYIENPYARNSLDIKLLPINSAFTVVNKTDLGFQMNWIKVMKQ